jgi:multiple sugar transport system substrate-binding protein
MDEDEKLFQDRVNRRDFLLSTAALGVGGVLGTGLAGTSFAESLTKSSNVNIAFWNLFSGGDGGRMKTMISQFNSSQAGKIKVTPTTLTWGVPYYTKLTTSTVAGQAPDVAILHLSRLASFAPKGLLQEIDSGMLKKTGVSAGQVSSRPWSMAHSSGKLYALPLDTHPMVMYYNKDIVKKAGLLGANGRLKPIQGAAAWLNVFKKVKKMTGQFPLSMDTVDEMNWRVFYILYSQLGGKVLSPDGKSVALNNAKAMKALAFMRELTQTAKVARPSLDYPGSVAAFASGKAAFMWDGEWEATTFMGKLPFDMVVFPNIFGSYADWTDSHAFVLPHQRSVDETKQAAALAFMGGMLKSSLTWAKGGHIPAYTPVVHSAAYKKLVPMSHYAQEVKYVNYDPHAPFAGAAGPMEVEAGKAFSSLYTGQKSPQAALSQFRGSLQNLISSTH